MSTFSAMSSSSSSLLQTQQATGLAMPFMSCVQLLAHMHFLRFSELIAVAQTHHCALADVTELLDTLLSDQSGEFMDTVISRHRMPATRFRTFLLCTNPRGTGTGTGSSSSSSSLSYMFYTHTLTAGKPGLGVSGVLAKVMELKLQRDTLFAERMWACGNVWTVGSDPPDFGLASRVSLALDLPHTQLFPPLTFPMETSGRGRRRRVETPEVLWEHAYTHSTNMFQLSPFAAQVRSFVLREDEEEKEGDLVQSEQTAIFHRVPAKPFLRLLRQLHRLESLELASGKVVDNSEHAISEQRDRFLDENSRTCTTAFTTKVRKDFWTPLLELLTSGHFPELKSVTVRAQFAKDNFMPRKFPSELSTRVDGDQVRVHLLP